MRAKLISLILFTISLWAANANYSEQDLSYPSKKVLYNSRSGSSIPFKLGVEDTVSSYAPSEIGIIGVKYLHRIGEMSTIIAVYPNTPAEAAGIRVGDKLLAVDGVNIMNYTADQVFAAIAGRPGEPVNLKLMRCPNNMPYGCNTYYKSLKRMDMNAIASDNVFRVYRYGN